MTMTHKVDFMNWFKKIDKRLWEFAIPIMLIEVIGLLVMIFVYP